MQDEAFDRDPLRTGLPIDADEAAASIRLLMPLAATANDDAVAFTMEPSPDAQVEPVGPAPAVDRDGNLRAEAPPDHPGWLGAWLGDDLFTAAPASDGGIDPARILRDRPDVYAAFYRDFYGANNDRSSPAWIDRVGGETPEDYARDWYKAHGRHEGYMQDAGFQGAPPEGVAEAPSGRTTADGIPLAKILSDRPDVFQAFFTEFYGPNNDRHSDAWAQRVGGTTVEDYADYWYNAHGRMEGYVPSRAPPAADPDAEPAASPDSDARITGR